MGLGDNFPRKVLHVKKSALGLGLTEPQTTVDHLVIKSCTGNKRSKVKWTNMMSMHKEISEDDSRLPRIVRRKKDKLKHWKTEWI